MCTLVLSFPMGGFSKHNVKRKYEDCRFDYKNISSMKFIKKKANMEKQLGKLCIIFTK